MKLSPLPWRKLSEDAAYPKTPLACQCCGQDWDTTVFIECDEADRPTATAITVCEDCVKVHVTPHARLYLELEHNRPFPGAMDICIDCPHRDGMRCTHHLLKANGGPGLSIKAAEPVPMFLCGKHCNVVMDYGGVTPHCEGRPIIPGTARTPKLRLLAQDPASTPTGGTTNG